MARQPDKWAPRPAFKIPVASQAKGIRWDTFQWDDLKDVEREHISDYVRFQCIQKAYAKFNHVTISANKAKCILVAATR
jgi:hypothetical protein